MQQRLIDVLILLGDTSQCNSFELSQKFECSHEDIVSALKSLESRCYVKLTQQQTQKYVLTKEGELCRQNGTPEHIVYSYLMQQENKESLKSQLENLYSDIIKVALSNGMKALFEIKGDKICAIDP